MAFGQAAGPPATSQQVRALSALLEAAGHSDFRDARGPLGLSQRQAGGKFTRDEADELIERLEREAEMAEMAETAETAVASAGASDVDRAPAPRRATSPASDRRDAERAKALAKFTDEVLAAELQRRGWVVMEP
jgi:hypothetical protein